MSRTVKAYAKINLFLDVTGILADGYHSVNTVMQTVSLHDDVTVSLREDGKVVALCNLPSVPSDEKNIAVRAAKLFFGKIGKAYGALIEIKKNIPMAAGLAGGSADAAATLIALNDLMRSPLSIRDLCLLGSTLGADVPFCIMCGTGFADGKGDILHECGQLKEGMIFVIGCGGEGVSTPWAYKLLDIEFNSFSDYDPQNVNEILKALESEEKFNFCDAMFNIFESPVSRKRHAVEAIKAKMRANFAVCSMMSGSGPAVFGVFEKLSDAEKAARDIEELGYFSSVAFSVAKR